MIELCMQSPQSIATPIKPACAVCYSAHQAIEWREGKIYMRVRSAAMQATAWSLRGRWAICMQSPQSNPNQASLRGLLAQLLGQGGAVPETSVGGCNGQKVELPPGADYRSQDRNAPAQHFCITRTCWPPYSLWPYLLPPNWVLCIGGP